MVLLRCVLLAAVIASSTAFQTLFANFQAPFGATKQSGAKQLEDQLLAAIAEQDRLSSSDEIDDIVTQLEASNKSLQRPAIAPEVYGRWRLMHTTNAATASPIQRKAVDASKYAIYQDIVLNDDDQLVVSQVVKFGDNAELVVDALASTSAYPLEELTQRKSTGKVMGLNILGVSLVGQEADPDPNRPDSRIDFVFDQGNFQFGDLKVPYPVPFRVPLFRDWVKGWIDLTYLSDRVRISRGNKGTTFVLVKEEDES
jgi:hypothetical protein